MTPIEALRIIRDCADHLAEHWFDEEAHELREAADCLEGALPRAGKENWTERK